MLGEKLQKIIHCQKVYCYPNENEWNQAQIGECNADMEWPNGFGNDLDQITGLTLEQKKNKTA
jgi:hypothetical protein